MAGAVIPVAGVGVAAHGATTAVVAGGHLAAAAFADNNQQGGGPYENTPQNQERMSKGKAPVGKDGKPVELHHEGQASEGNLQEPSQIDRSKFKQQREQYWKDKAKQPDQ